MKKIVFFILVAFSATFISSCEQCSTCSYTYSLNGADSLKAFPQTCGTKKDIEDYETAVKTESVKLGGKVTCTEE